MEQRSAIVLAIFGTTVEPALRGILGIHAALEQAFPSTPVRLAFTSNQIRHVWRRRRADPDYRAAHPAIPVAVLGVQGPLAAMANLQDEGFDSLVVQPAHIAPAEEYHDLCAYVRSLASIRTMKPHWRPFKHLAVGRPALGAYDLRHPYTADINNAAVALAEDAALARREGAALLYMGHGNRFFPSGGVYLEFAARMRRLYPDVHTLIGTVEGFPAIDEVLEDLRLHRIRKVVLKPFLIVAGEHARRDMTGPEADSWQSLLEAGGIEVVPALIGLGEQAPFARIFVTLASEAAAEAGIILR